MRCRWGGIDSFAYSVLCRLVEKKRSLGDACFDLAFRDDEKGVR